MKNIHKISILTFIIFILSPIGLLGFMIQTDFNENDVISLSNRREIFVDDFLINELTNVKIIKHTPVDEGIVLYFDKPWEGKFSGYVTIIKTDNQFRAYYRGVPESGRDGNENEVTCYAVSPDGIHWEKPNLGLFEVNGTFNNNVVLANAAPVTHNFSPFIDLNPSISPQSKYKAIGGTKESGLITYESQDGIHWQKMKENAVFKEGFFDSQNVAFWSESEKQYVCYFRILSRGGTMGSEEYRSVGRTTSKDFLHWTEPVMMSFGGQPMEHLYTQQTSPYFRAPHIYIAIGGRFVPGRQVLSSEQAEKLKVDPGYFKDCSDAIMMTTRGGNEYVRTFMEAFIRPGIGLNNWVSRSNYPALNVVQTGPKEMSIYVNQDYAQPTAHLHRYSLRLDGFTSLNASYTGGEFTTKPFTFLGEQLEINYSTSAVGEIRIEIQEMNGKPIPGFGLDDCEVVIGNEIARTINWKSNRKLSELQNKVVRLRIFLKDADLYSIKFQD